MKHYKIPLTLLFLVGCTDSSGAKRILEAQGFTNIETTGYALTGCSDDDQYQTGFKAKGATGKTVEGVVCCGLVWKNCTVRFK